KDQELTMRLVLPKTHARFVDCGNLPMFFLAGPILGGGDWHARFTEKLMSRFDDLIVVNPSRYDSTHPHYQYAVRGPENTFERQTDWERYYLKAAAEEWPTGCIIFWLA